MLDERGGVPGVIDDPVLKLILSGQAKNLDDAEELYLDRSLPAILQIIGSAQSNSALERHPLMQMLRRRGMRGQEDSLL